MSVLKVIEIMASSKKSWEDAAETGVAKAAKTLKNIRSAWVQDQSIAIDKGKIKGIPGDAKIDLRIGKIKNFLANVNKVQRITR